MPSPRPRQSGNRKWSTNPARTTIAVPIKPRQPRAANAKRLYEIKPLVWHRAYYDMPRTNTVIGWIQIDPNVDGFGVFHGKACVKRLPTVERAKAYAERWYQQRLLRALRECKS